ncbi:Outer membrane protein (OmpH-like) [Poriferisphaera corsica]|uniref:Outer membrane protein (OmpH-like) n=1 Tax=Poriferisphaera corsica TaxID=2528020 RepID=A0A517YPM6_9BACT|nr:OmpH family outer membrane protein [Poriferisphaera corsica]QDU32174.1 Outer membrane protein (OmpH-like) [Poriferisphaera corsica]
MTKRKLIVLSAAFTLLFVAFAGAGAASKMLAQPTAVAVVDISKVMQGLKARLQLEADMKKAQEDFMKEMEGMKQELIELRDELELLEGTQGYDAKRASAEEKAFNMQAKDQFKRQMLEREAIVSMEMLYRKVVTAVDRVATANGYEIVVARESMDTMGTPKNLQELQGQMMTRKVLYAADTVDLTTSVIQTMNNDFDVAR